MTHVKRMSDEAFHKALAQEPKEWGQGSGIDFFRTSQKLLEVARSFGVDGGGVLVPTYNQRLELIATAQVYATLAVVKEVSLGRS